MKKVILFSLLGLAVLFVVYKIFEPTRILFVNYRDWQVAEYIDANTNRFIKVNRSSVEDLTTRKLRKHDLVVAFGMGMRLTEAQRDMVTGAAQRGTKFLFASTTTPEDDITNIDIDKLNVLREYLSHGGNANINSLFNYTREEIHGKRFFVQAYSDPVQRPTNFFSHVSTDELFGSYGEFISYYQESGIYKEGSPRVLILTSNTSMANRVTSDPYTALVNELESRGMNVFVASGFSARLQFIKEVNPSVVLLFAHGRLQPGMPDETVNLLKEKNIPLLSPIVVHQLIDGWEEDQMGLSGGMLGQSVVAPEVDGATTPFVIGGLSYNDQGYQVFRAIDERISRFSSMVKNYVNLQKKDNSDKKLALVYFKGPGLNALAAAGLEVTPSLLNTLNFLRESGYDLGDNLPKTEKELDDLIDKLGPVLGPYAEGSIHEFMKDPRVVKIHADTLFSWMEENLRSELVQNVVSYYGKAPGNYLVTTDTADGSRYLALPGIKFGNVMILPQLMPALGDDQFALVHGVDRPPPYPYIATYLYAKMGHNADALIHFGTHGSLEFTPSKQSALSSLDWPDALVGDLPHFYIYTINNIGEAIIAKRRSYADIISHITPPFAQSDLYGGLYDLHNYIDQYEMVEDGPLKAQLREMIYEKIIQEGLHLDLSIEHIVEEGLDEESFDRVHRYLHVVEMEKITQGLYTIGKSYTEEQVISTVVEMFGDRIAYAQAALDNLEGKVTLEQIDDLHFYEENYYDDARDLVAEIAKGEFTEELLELRVLEKYSQYKKHIVPEVEGDMLEAMMAMGTRQVAVQSQSMGEEDLNECITLILSQPNLKEILISFEDVGKFERMQSFLDPANFRQAKRMARVVAPMRDAIAFFETPCAPELIRHLSDTDTRANLINLVKRGEFSERVAQRKKAQADSVALLLSAQNAVAVLRIAADGSAFPVYLDNNKDFEALLSTEMLIKQFLSAPKAVFESEHIDENLVSVKRSQAQVSNLQKSLELVNSEMESKKGAMREYIARVEEIKEAEKLIIQMTGYIRNSGTYEMQSLVNALNGGYIAPSSGGDVIYNPRAIPTGRNLYGIDAETTPGTAAWNAGVNLANQMIQRELASTGEYPRKVAFTLWGGEFIRDQGTTIAQVLYLLGVEPVRASTGRVHDIRLIPESELGRPRIDVVVQTSGQFRDIAASRLFLIDRAVQLAAQAREENNFVRDNVREAEGFLKERGYSPAEARELATARVFGGVNGNYGTGIQGLVESGDQWDSDTVIANQYLQNMGAVYTQGRWGEFKESVFEAGLMNTDVIMHSRSSNTWGPLSLDHVYEFMGGLNTAVKKVTGKDPQGLFIDMRNPGRMEVFDAREAIWTEARSTILNPNYISPLLEGGRSSAGVFAETVRNTYGWNATKESVIDEQLWDRYYETLVRDTLELGIREFFEEINPYALQEITAVMLETIRKEMWSPDSAVVQDLADIHVKLIENYDPGCSGFVCDNTKLAEMIASLVSEERANEYRTEISSVRHGPAADMDNAIVLKKETISETLVRLARDNSILLGALALMIIVLTVPFLRKKKSAL
ncbi:CobN/magnesium chelatase family protein [Chitinispirillum alkaliphilum]|nr:CobN/magnesium chelatase family protein [Chitinispirillum alkaliphilum]